MTRTGLCAVPDEADPAPVLVASAPESRRFGGRV